MRSAIGIILFMFVSLTIQLSISSTLRGLTLSSRIKRQSHCTESLFECKSGQCVDMDGVCDGRPDCADGSDETSETCSSVPCPGYAYRCSYGGCVSKHAKCNGIHDCLDGSDETECRSMLSTLTTPQHRSGCLMPAHPQHGRFHTLDGSNIKPNDVVGDYTVIIGSCNEGFASIMAGPMFCLNEIWIPEIPEKFCISKCKPLKKSHTYILRCHLDGRAVDCENAENGTIAMSKCATFYTGNNMHSFENEEIVCIDGLWSGDLRECAPECGRKHVSLQVLTLEGRDERIQKYPWVVAVYNSFNDHICGGCIIHERYVLSAAHCFTTDNGTVHNSSDYKIAAGTSYRKFDDRRDRYKQIVNVLDIHTFEYRGSSEQFANDIALVKLQTSLRLSEYVQPVCLDKHYNDNELDKTNAVVVGWGHQSDTRKELIVPFRTKDVCMKEMPKIFRNSYYTNDKICAGYIDNSTSSCSNDGTFSDDSGGGLYIQSVGLFYVRGILSISSPSICSSNYFALYTNVSSHMSWILDTLNVGSV